METIKVGAHVRISSKLGIFEGIVMPRSELSGTEHIVLKLSSGYNIGIAKNEINKIEKLAAGNLQLVAGSSQISNLKSQTSNLPSISIVSTGGTITSKVDYKTGGVFPHTKPEELLAGIPELGKFANIKTIASPFSILSEDMTSKEWAKIAKEVYKKLKEEVQGVVVTHGTDTLHFTAAALSFALRNLNKPVAVVGAQRSADRGSFDGVQNLLCATHYCLSDIAEVSIVMHGNISDDYCIACRGTKVRKMHSSRRDAFRPVNSEPLAKVFPDGNIVILNSEYKQRSEEKVELSAKFEEKVALVYSYPGAKPELLDFYVSKGYKGVIIAGTGFGHVSTSPLEKKFSWLPSIKKATEKGVFVGITTQTLYGKTNPLIYSTGRLMLEAGCVFLEDMLPETAYVKLSWVLEHTKKTEEIKKMMLTNYANEFNERLEPEMFMY